LIEIGLSRRAEITQIVMNLGSPESRLLINNYPAEIIIYQPPGKKAEILLALWDGGHIWAGRLGGESSSSCFRGKQEEEDSPPDAS
jgi:hypothetical protein